MDASQNLSFGEELWAAGLVLRQTSRRDVARQNANQQSKTAHQALRRDGRRLPD